MSAHIAEGDKHTVNLPKIWSDALTEFTANQIPIHLIDLHTLRLVSRSDVARHYRPILAAHLQKKARNHHPSSRQHASQQHDVTHSIFKLVKYAIFSHRWLAEGEPTFEDMPMVSTFTDVLIQDDQITLADALAARIHDLPTRAGLRKLLLFCSKARSYNCRFAWSDTCCIHKDSSAELDESIRAMFRWYHNAHICIVHLASSLVPPDIPSDEWFTRGWTLQELLAPDNIKFYIRDWKAFQEARNDKDRRNDAMPEEERDPVWRAILAATHIPGGRLGYFSPGPFDVAQRLSWAAGRRTTRIEDTAYALVGIFGIHMPVQYGEGKFSFQRLMEALLLRVREYGIFVWTGPSSSYSAALPASIEGYSAAREAENCVSVPNEYGDPSVTLTHKGLQVEVLLVPMQCREAEENHDEQETSSDRDAEERLDQETDSDEHSGKDEQHSEGDNDSDFVTAPQATPPLSEKTDSDDDLDVRFLANDEEYQPASHSPFSRFHFTDPDGVFKPFSVRGRGPILFFDDFTYPGIQPQQYVFAILDYHRDWARGPGCAHLPYPQKSRYLAFVLYRDDPGDMWQKLETDALVYAEVEAGQAYEGQTISICL